MLQKGLGIFGSQFDETILFCLKSNLIPAVPQEFCYSR
jgi:hypothetical protein